MKNLIVCCDGTWQKIDSPYPTNVAKLVQAVAAGPQNIVFYGEGVGTGDLADRFLGGAFGWGIDKNIQDAYRFLCLNYSPGDQIFLFGFSRGAFTVRSLVGLIRAVGILPRYAIRKIPAAYQAYQDAKGEAKEKQPDQAARQNVKLRESAKLAKFRADMAKACAEKGVAYDKDEKIDITFLGCWDTVGSLGIPDQLPWLPIDQWINRKYEFHNTTLSSIICHARHAVAIDENRKEFNVTPMLPADSNKPDQVKQVWFPGGHGCIGGGTKSNSPLSNAALLWMMEEVEALALPLKLSFDRSKIEDGVLTDPTIYFDDEIAPPFTPNQRIIPATNSLHLSVKERWQALPWYRPDTLLNSTHAANLGESLQPASVKRLAVGQSAQFFVIANEEKNETQIELEADGKYRIQVSPLQVWRDDQIPCNASGWQLVKTKTEDDKDVWLGKGIEEVEIPPLSAKFINASPKLWRFPQAQLMELIVQVNKEKHKIGLAADFTATESGQLIAYANDVPLFYFNNHGWLLATITRLAA